MTTFIFSYIMTTEIKEEDIQKLLSEFQRIADEYGYTLTDNAEKIAKAKLRFFGIENWVKCPCVRDDEHACMSECCRNKVETTGVCHCNLFKKK